MVCYVDAGRIVKVQGVSPRQCAVLALAELGEDARFPITVHLPFGEDQLFILNEGSLASSH